MDHFILEPFSCHCGTSWSFVCRTDVADGQSIHSVGTSWGCAIILVSGEDGHVHVTRTFRRLPESMAFDAELFLKVMGTPWRPAVGAEEAPKGLIDAIPVELEGTLPGALAIPPTGAVPGEYTSAGGSLRLLKSLCDGSGESRQKARRKLERGLMPNEHAHFKCAQFSLTLRDALTHRELSISFVIKEKPAGQVPRTCQNSPDRRRLKVRCQSRPVIRLAAVTPLRILRCRPRLAHLTRKDMTKR